jgi:uncharacterized protein YwlG (UPF0340 family)
MIRVREQRLKSKFSDKFFLKKSDVFVLAMKRSNVRGAKGGTLSGPV